MGSMMSSTNDNWVAQVAEGMKFDEHKMRYDLIPPIAEYWEAAAFTYGTGKYDDYNWAKGMKWSRLYGATRRHMASFWAGMTYDPKTKLHHLGQAKFNLSCLIAFESTGTGIDDRRPEFGAPSDVMPLDSMTDAIEERRKMQDKSTR